MEGYQETFIQPLTTHLMLQHYTLYNIKRIMLTYIFYHSSKKYVLLYLIIFSSCYFHLTQNNKAQYFINIISKRIKDNAIYIVYLSINGQKLFDKY